MKRLLGKVLFVAGILMIVLGILAVIGSWRQYNDAPWHYELPVPFPNFGNGLKYGMFTVIECLVFYGIPALGIVCFVIGRKIGFKSKAEKNNDKDTKFAQKNGIVFCPECNGSVKIGEKFCPKCRHKM